MSLFSLFKKPEPSNAFSFDGDTLRFVSVLRRDGMITVETYGSQNLSGIIDDAGMIVDEAAFVNRIRTFATKHAIASANIVIPDAHAVCFHTHVAKQPPREMGDVIEDHIKTYCEAHDLLTVTEYISEYEVILETQFGYDIHVTLVPKNYANHLVRLFKQSGVMVPHIETAHHAVARSCINVPNGTGYVAISVGNKKTTVSVINGDHLVSHDVVSVGIETILSAVERRLRVPRTDAERIIERHGILKTHPDERMLADLYLALAPIIHSIDRQLISLGQLPYKQYGHRFVTGDIIVYGEGLSIKGLVAYLGEQTNLNAWALDVWAGRPDRAPIQNLPATETPNYAEALALALVYLK